MRTFQANSELEEILKANGFIETTDEITKIQGKKTFKRSKLARKEIYFDYINISICNGSYRSGSLRELSLNQLKMLLLYFNISPNDAKEVFPNGKIDFINADSYFASLEKELASMSDLEAGRVRRKKIKRILQKSNAIILKEESLSI